MLVDHVVATNIWNRRKELKMPRNQVVPLLRPKISGAMLHKWENSENRIPLHYLLQIAEILDTTVMELFLPAVGVNFLPKDEDESVVVKQILRITEFMKAKKVK